MLRRRIAAGVVVALVLGTVASWGWSSVAATLGRTHKAFAVRVAEAEEPCRADCFKLNDFRARVEQAIPDPGAFTPSEIRAIVEEIAKGFSSNADQKPKITVDASYDPPTKTYTFSVSITWPK